MRNWSFPHCVREANSWASCRGNGEFTLSGMSVRAGWMYFLSASPQRLATSSAKMLFQGFHLLFTFPVGKCGPTELQEWGKGMVVNTEGIPHRREGRENVRWGRTWLMAAPQDGCLQFRQCQASWPSRFISVIPILFDGVSLAFPFILQQLEIRHMIPFIWNSWTAKLI